MTLLGPIKMENTWKKYCLPRLEGQVNTGSHSLPEQRLRNRNHNIDQCRSRNTWITNDKMLEAQCTNLKVRNFRETQSYRAAKISWDLLLGAWPDSHSKYLKKNLFLFPIGRGEEKPFWNAPEHTVFLNKAFPEEKPVNKKLTYQKFIRAWQHWREISNSSPL